MCRVRNTVTLPSKYIPATEEQVTGVVDDVHHEVITCPVKVLNNWGATNNRLHEEELCRSFSTNTMDAEITIFGS